MNLPILLKRLPDLVLFGAGVALLGGALPASAAEEPPQVKNVSFSDIDLNSAAGQAAARERLRQVARLLCTRVEDDLDLSRHDNYIKCLDNSMAAATPKLQILARNQARSGRVAQNQEAR